MESKIYMNGTEIKFNNDAGMGIDHTDYDRCINFMPSSFSGEFKLDEQGQISLKKFRKKYFKLTRKLKKKIRGTRKARNRLYERIKLGLPVAVKDFERAGMKVIAGERNHNGV